MTINIAVKQEQEQRLAADLVAVEEQLDKETDTYAHGEFNGATGSKPKQELWGNLSYRSGYLAGVGQYYDLKFNAVFDELF